MDNALAVATEADAAAAVPAPAVPTAEELCAGDASRVHQFACMVAGDDVEAEDLAQAALERAIRALPRFDPSRGELAAWLWRIVANVARDAGRAGRRRRLLVERLHLRHIEPPPDDIPLGIADDDLLDAVRRLSATHRAVVGLRFGADLDYAGVGAALRISEGAARVATHRALKRLRADLLEERS